MHKQLWAPAVSAFLMGCATTAMVLDPEDMEPPARSAFPTRELAFVVRGPVPDVRQRLLKSLNARRLAYKQELSDPFTYVITVYTWEPPTDSLWRSRRASYLLRLAADSENRRCTDVSLNWIVESKGNREELWSVQPSDAEYVPRLREVFVKELEENACSASGQ